jgi:hypothetical protein
MKELSLPRAYTKFTVNLYIYICDIIIIIRFTGG